MEDLRKPIRLDRVRSIPGSFSWIDRDILHHGWLSALSKEELLLYFFLTVVAGPEGTSFWSHATIAKLLKLSLEEILTALQGLIGKDLVAFSYPTYQVLSLPERRTR